MEGAVGGVGEGGVVGDVRATSHVDGELNGSGCFEVCSVYRLFSLHT